MQSGRAGPTVREYRGSDSRAVAEVLAEAFLDDPVWISIGPRNRRHRALANRTIFRGILAASRRHGAFMRVAEIDAEPAGVSIAFDPDAWPLPERASLWELPWAAIVGPPTLIRGVRDDQELRRRHPGEPHLYLWYLATAPRHQGRGVGRALLADLHPRAERQEVPSFLETGTLENVAWYSGDGYEVIDEFDLPSGSHIWHMRRGSAGESA